jgi:hypothetical protein
VTGKWAWPHTILPPCAVSNPTTRYHYTAAKAQRASLTSRANDASSSVTATTEAPRRGELRNCGTAYLQHRELLNCGTCSTENCRRTARENCKRELQRLEPRRHGDTERTATAKARATATANVLGDRIRASSRRGERNLRMRGAPSAAPGARGEEPFSKFFAFLRASVSPWFKQFPKLFCF